MKTLYLIRGIPGAGKTDLARTLYDFMYPDEHYPPQFMIPVAVAADDFQVDADGNYEWIAERVGHCHMQCQLVVKNSMAVHTQTIIVHNTFTTEKELKPYLKYAEEYGYKVVSLIVENRHGNKNIHNVPDGTLDAMKNRFSVRL